MVAVILWPVAWRTLESVRITCSVCVQQDMLEWGWDLMDVIQVVVVAPLWVLQDQSASILVQLTLVQMEEDVYRWEEMLLIVCVHLDSQVIIQMEFIF
jgi:hypothetical protein